MPVVPQDIARLLGLAATAVAPAMHEIIERLRTPQVADGLMPDLVGDSAGMHAVRQAVARAAASPFPVLIEGESGSGKELVARAIHGGSVRRTRRFCALNCAALADDLVEAELFGHTRGAFTGAVAERLGLFEEAQGGTLFLDEVAELGTRVQAKLLRTLQEGEVRRLGESTTRRIDARIVAATNRPLAGEVTLGRFRSDLRYRLDVLRIAIPPLRDRLEDLPALVRHAWALLAQRTGSRAVLSPGGLQLARLVRLARQRPRTAERAGLGDGRGPGARRDRSARAAGAHHARGGDRRAVDARRSAAHVRGSLCAGGDGASRRPDAGCGARARRVATGPDEAASGSARPAKPTRRATRTATH